MNSETKLRVILRFKPVALKGTLNHFLFLQQRPLKDRPRIKACVIGPPQAPSISTFVNRQVNQQMNSTFLPPPAKLVTP
jgi:hypothetical protein